MRILCVGSLSWNPERLLALCERGHALFGLWGRSMAWDQGPYPALEGAVHPVSTDAAARTIRDERIECVYGLYQAYPREWWGPHQPGVEHELGVWDLLRGLLLDRARGLVDVPFVHHYGFDTLVLDTAVVEALDGHVVCNAHKLRYWTAPVAEGGLGLDAFGDLSRVAFLDGDLPGAEFMNDRFAPRLSDADGEIHTVCIGRPVNIDVLEAARRGIHVHVYGNAHDDVHPWLARSLSPRALRRHDARIARHLHVHPSLQTVGASRAEVERIKSGWVEEFSRYDAAWSYVGSPFPWAPLDDRAAIPSRQGTALLAGLPLVTDRRPGSYRYERLRELGVALELGPDGYDGLRAQLDEERASRKKSMRAREVRERLSFDAGIPALEGALARARERYLARPRAERIRFADRGGAIDLRPRDPDQALEAARPARRRSERRSRRRRHARRRHARHVSALLREGPVATRVADGASPHRRIAVFERFDERSRRCDDLAADGGVQIVGYELRPVHRDRRVPWRSLVRAASGWLLVPLRVRRPLRLLRACWTARDVRAGALRLVPEVARRVRAGEIDELACFSSKGIEFVPRLAEALGVPFTEILATRTQYFGEFAYEMWAVVPYAYWLHLQGRLERTVACEDTRCLYYFSDDHREVPGDRTYVPVSEWPAGEPGRDAFDTPAFPAHLDRSRWAPPPYAERFRDERFLWSRPTCVVCNKTSAETYLGEARVNSIGPELLLELVGRLRARYQVVYVRPRAGDIVNDHQRVGETGDLEALARAFPDVLTLQALHARHPELSFNELQLRIFAGCRCFVSVLGGSSYLASWFGGTNVVYARAGAEVDCGAYDHWFHAFSGARVVAAASPEALLDAVERELLG